MWINRLAMNVNREFFDIWPFRNAVEIIFLKNLIFFLLKFKYFYVLDCFDVLILKIIFKK
jgi:hypothetical protein